MIVFLVYIAARYLSVNSLICIFLILIYYIDSFMIASLSLICVLFIS